VIASIPATVALSAGGCRRRTACHQRRKQTPVTYDGVAPALASLDISDTALKIAIPPR